MHDLTVTAFNLAERFRTPVFLMADEIIGHMRERLVLPDSVNREERRPLEPGRLPFQADSSQIPGFPAFGRGYGVHVTGLTHDERGYPCATSPSVHEELVTRLVRKIESARDQIACFDVTNPGAETVFVSYGAPARTVQQVMHDLRRDDVGHLRLRTVWPFAESMLDSFRQAERFIVPEMNLGQMAREIERHTDREVIPVPKLGGALHSPEELIRVLEVAR
jgi:2-oxoglutarate ferredoxin oxidoreductase subunit alpha